MADESTPISYSAELEFVDDKFLIEVHGDGPGSLLVASVQRGGKPLGEPLRARLDGVLRNAAAVDLDGDQQAELVVIGGKAGFLAWTFAGGKFASLELPALTAEQAGGRKGDDDYALDGRTILRKVPLDGGKIRLIRYKLTGGQGFVVESVTQS